MKNTIIAGILGCAVALTPAAPAAAAPTGGSSASDTVAALQNQGYSVQVNGLAAVPLSQCTVTDVHGASGRIGTAYVDVSCPSDN